MKKVRDGYKMTELGDIPNEWRISALGNICEFKGRIGWRGYTKNDLREYGPLVIGATQISASNKLDFSNPTYLSTEKYEESPEIKVYLNDIILVKTGNTIGKVAIVDKEIGDATINPNTVLLKNITCFNKYLYYIVVSEIIQKPLNKSITVGAQPSVNQETLKKILIPIPTSKEQEKIASILSTVDEQIDNVDALIEKNKELKKGLMQTLFTKGIGHTKFKKTEIGEIPEEWDVKKIGDICEVKGGKRLPKGYQLEDEDNAFPYIRVADMYMGGIRQDDIKYVPKDIVDKIKNYKISKDDLFISVAGTLGIVGQVPYELDGANLTENADKLCNIQINKLYLMKVLQSNIIQSIIEAEQTKSAQPKLALTRIKEFLVPIPSDREQVKIVSILMEVDEKINVYENKKNKLEMLKKGLMQKLLTGKIRVI